MFDLSQARRHEVDLAPESHFSYNWNRRLVDLIGAVRAPSFAEKLVDSLRTADEFDCVTLFHYSEKAPPSPIFHTYSADAVSYMVDYYASEPFKLDPISHSAWCSGHDAFVSLRAPGFDLERSDYFRFFYRDSGMGDEVAFVTQLQSGSALVLSMLRRAECGDFTVAGKQRLSSQKPIICELMRQHWTDIASKEDAASVEIDFTSLVSQKVGDKLTKREVEIAALVLEGYCSEAIGLTLAISPGTVKVHRKNLYRKLRISSQAELFRLTR